MLSTHRVYHHLRIVLTNIGHARSFCMTSRLIYPEAGILYATSTVKIWIYRPGGLRPVTFLCSLLCYCLLQIRPTLYVLYLSGSCVSWRTKVTWPASNPCRHSVWYVCSPAGSLSDGKEVMAHGDTCVCIGWSDVTVICGHIMTSMSWATRRTVTKVGLQIWQNCKTWRAREGEPITGL